MIVTAIFSLFVICALLIVSVIALARQVGVLHERIAPMGALVTSDGPKAGDLAPVVTEKTLTGDILTVGGEKAKRTLLLFVAPDCPVCKKIIPIAMVLSRSDNLDLVFMGDGKSEAYEAMVTHYKMGAYPLINSTNIGMTYHIDKLPSAVLIKADGTIAAKGLVNSREHLESLVVADETGVTSAQDYIRQLQSAPEPQDVVAD